MNLLLRYSYMLAQFGSKLILMGGCINNDKAKPQHRQLRSLPFQREFFNVPDSQYRGNARDGAYGLSYSSEKTRMSNYFPMSQQKWRILPSCIYDPECLSDLELERSTILRGLLCFEKLIVKALFSISTDCNNEILSVAYQ